VCPGGPGNRKGIVKVTTEVKVSLKLTTDEQKKLKHFLQCCTSSAIRPIVNEHNEKDQDNAPYLSVYDISDQLIKIGNSL
jgi:hypothetical protein